MQKSQAVGIARLLRDWRISSGLTQEDAVEWAIKQLGYTISTRTWRRWESGKERKNSSWKLQEVLRLISESLEREE